MKQFTAGACMLVMAMSPLVSCSGTQRSAPESPQAPAPLRASGGFTPDANIPRTQVPDAYQWNLSPLFANVEAWQQGLADAARLRAELEACHGDLSNPDHLLACLELYFRTRLLTNKLTLYAQLQQATNLESPEIQGRVDQSQAAMEALMAEAAALRTGVLRLSDEALNQALAGRPALATYRPYFEEMRRRDDHVLGGEAERVLSLAGDNLWAEIDLNEIPSDFEKAFGSLLTQIPLPTITDASGQPVQMTLSNYGKLRASSDRRVRQEAMEGLFGALRSFDQTFAALLSGQASFTVFLARSRGYETALDAYLRKDNIDPEVYRRLVSGIESHLEPLHRYVRLRKRLMALDELHLYDLYTPIVPEVQRRIPYDEAAQTVTVALAPLGEEYLSVLRRGMDSAQGWIDVYPHQDKQSGAFSASVYGVHPFVMMNYFEEMRDLLTLAHEYGHALHSARSMEHQPYVTANYAPLVAETASTFNEVLVLRHLLAQAQQPDERLFLLGELVESIRGTVYRQALFASFELAVHSAVEQGVPLTAAFLESTYAGLLRRYYGDDLTLGPNDGMEWAYIPHLYYKYYVYTYAAGLCSGIFLGDRVLRGSTDDRDAYLNMLASGSSKPPLELLRDAGSDLTNPLVVQTTAQLMEASLVEMERILDQRPASN